VNIGEPWPDSDAAWARVLGMQTKLHQWATDDPERRFDDLYNLVYDPAFLVVAWERVRGNRGARSAGVDGVAPRSVVSGAADLLAGLRVDLKARSFVPLPVRERMIPKSGGKLRRLGIPTARDRVVQAALKLVLEPIFEADFRPCSHGFRPGRRAHDAIAEIRHLTSVRYEWVLEGDITACFDEIDHQALMDRVRHRVGDKRVLGLVKAFLKAGVLSEGDIKRDTDTGTPQGGVLSPLLANIALSVLDDHFAEAWQNEMATTWQRKKRRQAGRPNYRLIRYADDFASVPTPKHSGRKQQPFWPPSGFACRRPRRRLSTSTRASTSSAGASSVTASEARPNTSSTPTRPRPPCGRSWPRSRRCAAKDATNRSPNCCAGSTRCCGAGPTTSGTECPRPPSATCGPTSGTG
jgi:group II intron reverse transcriptase/maturase